MSLVRRTFVSTSLLALSTALVVHSKPLICYAMMTTLSNTKNHPNQNESAALTDTAPGGIFRNTGSRLVYGKDDALFGSIEQLQGQKPFGHILDAGTGLHSLRWIATLGEERGMTQFTAITADRTMQQNVQREVDALNVSHMGNVVIGNWFPSSSSSTTTTTIITTTGGDGGQSSPLDFPPNTFDVILADYLIGAMDGFSPYQQDLMIPKLSKYLKPGGMLYIVGLQPIPDVAEGHANIICRVRQVRDACILLAGHRCYREYPVEWIQRQVQQWDPLELVTTTQFPILYKHATILNQINVGRSKFSYFPTPELAKEMKKVLDDLERQSIQAFQTVERIKLGFDYIVTARKKDSKEHNGNDDAPVNGGDNSAMRR